MAVISRGDHEFEKLEEEEGKKEQNFRTVLSLLWKNK